MYVHHHFNSKKQYHAECNFFFPSVGLFCVSVCAAHSEQTRKSDECEKNTHSRTGTHCRREYWMQRPFRIYNDVKTTPQSLYCMLVFFFFISMRSFVSIRLHYESFTFEAEKCSQHWRRNGTGTQTLTLTHKSECQYILKGKFFNDRYELAHTYIQHMYRVVIHAEVIIIIFVCRCRCSR